ncbi:hypothetical protein Hanom_Chr08g00694421 [Helianthus anomalus]
MAAFLSSFKTPSSSWKLFMLIFLMTFLVNPSFSSSRGEMTTSPKHHEKSAANFATKTPELFLGMLPKGKPTPPSGPSRSHN